MNLKRILIIFTKSILLLLLIVGIYVLCAILLPKITIEKEKNNKEEIIIYILTNGVHTDIALPVKSKFVDWSKKIKFENTAKKDSTALYVALGWGDKGFYLETPEWIDLKASVAFNAATGLGASAIHATFYNNLKQSKTCKKILISENQYLRLIDYIDKSFTKDSQQNYINIKTNAHYGKNDSFYEANGSYSIFHTCNTWANNSLKSCGQKCCFWTPLDTGIFEKYN